LVTEYHHTERGAPEHIDQHLWGIQDRRIAEHPGIIRNW
jgi:hypothetical protein